jgi:hypothetical protein
MRNGASGNPEIPGSLVSLAPRNDARHSTDWAAAPRLKSHRAEIEARSTASAYLSVANPHEVVDTGPLAAPTRRTFHFPKLALR